LNSEIRSGFRAAVPILVGYFPIAMTFGLIAKNMDTGWVQACAMSVFVFAGASQFMALNLIGSGIGFGQILMATLLLNFRHFLMSASLSSKIERQARFLPLISFGITDETFAVASTQNRELKVPFMIGLEATAYTSWVVGTVVGYGLGEILPDAVQKSLGISLYALFIAILIPEVKRSARTGLIALTAGLSHMVLGYVRVFAPGWNLIIAILAGASLGAALYKRRPGGIS